MNEIRKTRVYRKRVGNGPNQTEIVEERTDTTEPERTYSYGYVERPGAARLIYYLLDIALLLLAARFLLRMLGANSAAGFTNLIYSLTNPLVAPFRGIFPSTATSGLVFDWPAVVAAIAYAIIAWILARLITAAEAPDYRTR